MTWLETAPPSAPAPRRETFLPFHRPSIGEEEIEAVTSVLRSGWLTTGPRVKELEAAFQAFIGAPHALAVNSATAALHLALEASGVGPGDEVIVPSMTFAASAEVVIYLGARPVLADCDEATMNLDPAEIDRLRTPRTKAVMPVHFGGMACDMDPILAAARGAGLRVVEDAAHALPTRYRGRTVGTIGDFTCFSFYATKTMTTGEGGMVVTADEEAAARMRMMSLHGLSRQAWKRYGPQGSWFYEILEAGFKYNLTDVAAALGLAQLAKLPAFTESRRAIARRYAEGFADLPELRCPVGLDDPGHAWHLFVIRLDLARLSVDRAAFIDAIGAENIGCSVHFIPLHLHPYYRDRLGYTPAQLPVASRIYEGSVSLPIYPAMSEADIDDVIHAVRRTVLRNRR
jgi:perosamine synthetase